MVAMPSSKPYTQTVNLRRRDSQLAPEPQASTDASASPDEINLLFVELHVMQTFSSTRLDLANALMRSIPWPRAGDDCYRGGVLELAELIHKARESSNRSVLLAQQLRAHASHMRSQVDDSHVARISDNPVLSFASGYEP